MDKLKLLLSFEPKISTLFAQIYIRDYRCRSALLKIETSNEDITERNLKRLLRMKLFRIFRYINSTDGNWFAYKKLKMLIAEPFKTITRLSNMVFIANGSKPKAGKS